MSDTPKPEPELDAAAQANQVLAADRQRRTDACTAAIQDALKRYRCALDVSVTLRAGQVLPQVQIVAQD